ncbi:MAG TPA: response regulator [Acidobacteriota bacterium]|nr:response regulator [Acidobacteriota bacterium]
MDDVDGVRELICEVLEMAGYEVLLARDGLDALQVAEDHYRPIDLLLTDVVMPHMGGQELANNLSSRWPETKIIFMSGYSDEAISRQGVLKEGTAFIKKPFTADSLTRQIRRELDA